MVPLSVSARTGRGDALRAGRADVLALAAPIPAPVIVIAPASTAAILLVIFRVMIPSLRSASSQRVERVLRPLGPPGGPVFRTTGCTVYSGRIVFPAPYSTRFRAARLIVRGWR